MRRITTNVEQLSEKDVSYSRLADEVQAISFLSTLSACPDRDEDEIYPEKEMAGTWAQGQEKLFINSFYEIDEVVKNVEGWSQDDKCAPKLFVCLLLMFISQALSIFQVPIAD